MLSTQGSLRFRHPSFVLFLVLPCLVASVVGQEAWTLTVTGTLKGQTKSGYGAANTSDSASGSVTLRRDTNGNYAGTGNLSVRRTIELQPDSGVIRFSPLAGSGGFTVSAHRQGNDLILHIAQGAIVCRGTVTVISPAGTETRPYQDSFDPSSLASPGGVVIERREGATAGSQVNVAATGISVHGASRFSLSGGANLIKDTGPSKGEFSASPDRWTLELEIVMVQEMRSDLADAVTRTTVLGSVQFPLPKGDGPAKGEGAFTMSMDSDVSRPMPVKSHWDANGDLVLDGAITDDVLTFRPILKMKGTSGSQTGPGEGGVSGNTDFSGGLLLSENAEPVSISVEDNAEVVQNQNLPLGQGVTSTAKTTWRLRGKKTERWRVTIDLASRLTNGGAPIAIPRPAAAGKKDPNAPAVKWSESACGLNVQTTVVVDVTIENGKFKQASGTSRFVSLIPYSQPPGVYDVKSAALEVSKPDGSKVTTPYVTDPSFTVKSGVKAGQWLDLDLFMPKFQDMGFWVGFEAVLNEQEAEKKIAYWNDPVSGKKSSMRRNLSDRQFVYIPPRVSVMLVDGWKVTSGDSGSVDSEVLTVHRID